MISEEQLTKIKALVEEYSDCVFDLAIAEADYSGLGVEEPQAAHRKALHTLNTYLETLLND